MQRVVIIGCSGSGKSTLARQLGTSLRLPIHHLDMIYWRPGWQPHPDPAVFQAEVRALCATERWIIDGGFTSGNIETRLARADTVILFDLPRLVCLWRAIKRWITYRGETRPDLAPGCPEKFDMDFYKYIWTYRREKLPVVERDLTSHFRGRLVRIRNDRELEAFLTESAS